MTAVQIVAAALFAILMLALIRIRRVRELHHGYYGALTVALASLAGWPVWLAWLGVLLLLDDAVQHVAEALGFVPRMADFTPIHMLGRWLLGRIERSAS